MKLLSSILTCYKLKDVKLNVCTHGGKAYYNVYDDVDFMKYNEARGYINRYKTVHSILKRLNLI